MLKVLFSDPSNRTFVPKAVCNHDFGGGACGVCALKVVLVLVFSGGVLVSVSLRFGWSSFCVLVLVFWFLCFVCCCSCAGVLVLAFLW